MNKLVACCMEGQVVVWDLRTQHPDHGFASTTYMVQPSATLFAAAHLPQNRCARPPLPSCHTSTVYTTSNADSSIRRDVWMVAAGDGSLQLLRYAYPDKRTVPENNVARGVAGTVHQVRFWFSNE